MASRGIVQTIYLLFTWPLNKIARFMIRYNIWYFKNEHELITKQFQQSMFIKIEQLIIKGLVISEDRRFDLHYGYDPYAICRAIINRILHKKAEGASTIEQQLVRTITGHYEISLTRKIKEILLATVIANDYGKTEIAATYLDIAHFGSGIYGIHRMCKLLGIPFDHISIVDTAEIISMLKHPRPSVPTSVWLTKHGRRSDWLKKKLIRMSLAPNPPLNSDPACGSFRSLSTSRFLGSAHHLGAGGAG